MKKYLIEFCYPLVVVLNNKKELLKVKQAIKSLKVKNRESKINLYEVK